MHVVAVSPLPTWENFYVIIGTAAATLTGLMFVVVTLTARLRQQSGEGVAAFGTPTVVHFGIALFIAATLCAPWQALWHVGLVLGICGVGSFIYTLIVVRRMIRQTTYKPVLEDWVWHMMLPFVSYTALVLAALMLSNTPMLALFVIGGVTILLLFIGIHNSWDTVTFVVAQSQQEKEGRDEDAL